MKNKQTEERRVWKLKENNMKERFQERLKEWVIVDAPNVCNAFNIGILKGFDDMQRRMAEGIMVILGCGMRR